MDTLLLNLDSRPLRLLNWQDAVSLVYKDKVYVIEEYDDWTVRSPSVEMQVPSVLGLKRYQKFKPKVRFNRINIYIRDGFSCQYCGRKAGKSINRSELEFDHVVPQSHGGKTTWQNIVTSCRECNRDKADRTPSEANMSLKREPFYPESLNPVEFKLINKEVPDDWSEFIEEPALV